MRNGNVYVNIAAELRRANGKYPQFRSCHEAAAVIREEFDEYWDEVKACKGERPNERMVEELVQLAAMCVKEIGRFDRAEPVNPFAMGR